MATHRGTWPNLVRVVLWGLPTRRSAWFCFWLSVVLSFGSVAYGFSQPRFFAGSILVIAAVGYYLAIRWVDRHGSW